MTEFQHPAEQGLTAEEFLEPQKTFPMFQYSVFLDDAKREQIVVRARDFSEFQAGKRNIDIVLNGVTTQNGATNNNGQSNGHSNGLSNGQSVCEHSETKVFTVKKAGPNQGREFKSCTQCREFLGFV